MLIRLAILIAIGLLLDSAIHAQNSYLDRVEELQTTAQKANRGQLGCGAGAMVLVTSNGDLRVGLDLDPIHVFGRRVVVSDLVELLQARADSNRTGETSPMSGDVYLLSSLVLRILALSKDPTVIPVLTELLEDDHAGIRGLSTIALFRLAASDEDLRTMIEAITFPVGSIQSAKERGVYAPTWIRTKP
jgi:hypothetical protein